MSARPLRLLFVTDLFPPGGYGSGQSTLALARGLRERGHEVRVAVAGVAWRYAAAEYDGFPVWRPDGVALPAALGELGIGPGGTVRRLVREWRPDVIHAQHLRSALVAVRAGRGVPTVVTVRDHWPVCFYGTKLSDTPCPGCLTGTRSPCNARKGEPHADRARHAAKAAAMQAVLAARRAALQRAAAVVAVSGAIAAELAPVVAPARLHVVPNGIAVPAPGPPPAPDLPPRYFLYIGKLAAHKGADRLPAIVAALPPNTPPLLICGDGPEEQALRTADPTGRRIRLLGVLPNADVLTLLTGAVALISPARWDEPLSRTHLEALAVGCPVVATATGGTTETVDDGITGYLVPRDAPAADFAARLAHLTEDDALRARMGDAARAKCARQFAMPHIAATMEALYRDLTGGKGR